MPLGENGGIKLAFKNIQSDSHVYNTTLNDRRDFRDSTTVSASIRYDFTENTSVLFTYDDYDHDTIAPDNLMVGPFPESLTGYLASQNDDYKTSPQLNPLEASMWGDNSTLQLTHNWAGHQFKYTMGIMDYEEEVEITDERFSESALISLEKAKLLLKEKTKGEIVEFETSLQNGRPVYEFDVFEKDQGIEIEYEIDGVTGLFLESEIELFEIGEDKR